jgi:hypothetical protein
MHMREVAAGIYGSEIFRRDEYDTENAIRGGTLRHDPLPGKIDLDRVAATRSSGKVVRV